MKIAIIGSHRTGKTTLAEHLHDALPEYDIIAEPYILLEEDGYLFPDVPSTEDYLIQFETAIIQIMKSQENTIFDRCPLDLLAYIHTSDNHTSVDFHLLYEKMKKSLTEIDFFIFTGIENPDMIDCPDPDLPELRTQVDQTLQDLMWDFDIEVIEVYGTPRSRLNKVLNHLNL